MLSAVVFLVLLRETWEWQRLRAHVIAPSNQTMDPPSAELNELINVSSFNVTLDLSSSAVLDSLSKRISSHHSLHKSKSNLTLNVSINGITVEEMHDMLQKWSDRWTITQIKCFENKADFDRLISSSKYRLSQADRQVAAISLALTKAQSRLQAVMLSESSLEEQRADAVAACGEHRKRQADEHGYLAGTADDLDQVMEDFGDALSPKMKNELSKVGASIQDQRHYLQYMKGVRKEECSVGIAKLNQQILHHQNEHMLVNRFARALANEAEEAEHLQSSLLHDVTEYKEMQQRLAGECVKEKDWLTARAAAWLERRDELLAEKGKSLFDVVDCHVGNWIPKTPCNATCGGGIQVWHRKIIRAPDGGLPCPNLQIPFACNEQPCPTDCEMGDWSGWSECTADCDGGKRYRQRAIHVWPKHGGAACDMTIDLKECNTHGCMTCEYGNWSDWSQCSKACGGGQKLRHRDQIIDHGTYGFTRTHKQCEAGMTQSHECNMQMCPADRDVRCDATLDVVFVIDGSLAVAAEDFLDELAIVQEFVGRATTNHTTMRTKQVMMGAVLFGTDEAHRVVSPLTDKVNEFEHALTKAQQGKGGSQLEDGLAEAAKLLLEGRKGVQSTIIIIMKGQPDSLMLAYDKASWLMQHGARIAALVTDEPLRSSTSSFGVLVSEPTDANFFVKRTFESFRADMARQVINLCPRLQIRPSALPSRLGGDGK